MLRWSFVVCKMFLELHSKTAPQQHCFISKTSPHLLGRGCVFLPRAREFKCLGFCSRAMVKRNMRWTGGSGRRQQYCWQHCILDLPLEVFRAHPTGRRSRRADPEYTGKNIFTLSHLGRRNASGEDVWSIFLRVSRWWWYFGWCWN